MKIKLLSAACLQIVCFFLSADEYSLRRTVLMGKIAGGIGVIPADIKSGEKSSPNKSFYYLTGFHEEKAVLVIDPLGEKTLLFNESGTCPETGWGEIKTCSPLSSLPQVLKKYAASEQTLYLSYSPRSDALSSLPASHFQEIQNIEPLISEQRMIKSEPEQEYIKKAVDITGGAFLEAAKRVKPGVNESEVQKAIETTFINLGATGPGFETICGSGPNSTLAHYFNNNQEMKKGEVIVIDFGAKYRGYTADITRTLPVSGKFSKEQKEIYAIVLAAQREGISKLVKGASYKDFDTTITTALMKGLYRIGLVTDLNSEWQKKLFLIHGWGHYIGLDVHDLLGFMLKNVDKYPIAPGMIFTVEPALYFPESLLDSYPARMKGMVSEEEFRQFAQKIKKTYTKYRGFGVRIEDDVRVTETGNIVLSAAIPKEIRDIEKLMKSRKKNGST